METSVATVLPFWLLSPVAGGGTRSGDRAGPAPTSAGVEIPETERIERRNANGAPWPSAPFTCVPDRAKPPEVWEGDWPTRITARPEKTGSEKREGGLGKTAFSLPMFSTRLALRILAPAQLLRACEAGRRVVWTRTRLLPPSADA